MVGAGLAACLVTLVTTPLVIAYMRRLAVLDVANERTLHVVPTPRGGGAAVVLGLFAGVLVTVLSSGRASAPDLLPMTFAVALFGMLGLAEDVGGDVGGISPLRRLALQGLAALALTAVTVLSVAVGGGDVPGFGLVLVAAALGPLWITGFVNAFNFMDGVNGISAVQATVAGVGYVVVGTVHDCSPLVVGGAIVAGAALGFGPFNVPRALVFLGDVGSYAFGAAIAALALQAVLSGVPVVALVAPVLLYLADTAATLVRRVRAGERWYLPHRDHAYQRLVTNGWSHTAVAGLVGGCAAAAGGLGLAASVGGPAGLVAAGAGLCLLAAGYLAAPRLVADRRAARATSAPTAVPVTTTVPAPRAPVARTEPAARPTATSTPTPAPSHAPTAASTPTAVRVPGVPGQRRPADEAPARRTSRPVG
jgi:UDP-N-acetylmuramyl pentapeptide phosphotransferase/UDP-N-acetylglucosamine-1-phosphate transferase